MHAAETPESLAWAELQRRGTVRPRYLRGLEQEISAELARCFDPFVHEEDIRPYGAIVTRETPHLDRLGRIIETAAMSIDVLRSLADGQRGVVLVVTHDCPDVLAFVVSTDGPVTVFSDGRRIADLKRDARPKTPAAIEELIARRCAERKTL